MPWDPKHEGASPMTTREQLFWAIASVAVGFALTVVASVGLPLT
jgi:hypothetical protein